MTLAEVIKELYEETRPKDGNGGSMSLKKCATREDKKFHHDYTLCIPYLNQDVICFNAYKEDNKARDRKPFKFSLSDIESDKWIVVDMPKERRW